MSFMNVPSYVRILDSGELGRRADQLRELLKECTVCPHECRVNRLAGELGWCGAGEEVEIASYGPHFGEEAPLVGRYGSGTIFFSHCNLGCIFCQNYEISRAMEAISISLDKLAEIMLALQGARCHNINLVTPSHYVPQIVKALEIAARNGLCIPVVYNCGGYERVETLRLLEGIIDIYMPDFKYWDSRVAGRFSGVPDYPGVAREALREMHRQVGDLVVDERGIAVKGLIIRHLVLPGGLAGTPEVMEFIAREISPRSYVNVMAQYYPHYRAHEYAEISRRITREEYEEALRAAKKASGEFRLD